MLENDQHLTGKNQFSKWQTTSQSFRILLTEPGRRVFERIAAEHEAWLVELLSGAGPAALEALYEQLGELRVQLAHAATPESPTLEPTKEIP